MSSTLFAILALTRAIVSMSISCYWRLVSIVSTVAREHGYSPTLTEVHLIHEAGAKQHGAEAYGGG